jgi:hypothetical protein
MENRTINMAVLAEVASALGHMKDKVVFVGGAVVSLYTDDPAADEVRPTADIDLTIDAVSLIDWIKIQEELSLLGFSPDPQGHSICSLKYKNIPIDIMSTSDGFFGGTNSWYKLGFEHLVPCQVGNEEISILSSPFYLATKFEAFHNRGGDYRTSHDFEDIVYILDNRTTIVDEVRNSHNSVRVFLIREFTVLSENGNYIEYLSAHIHPFVISSRLDIVKQKISDILK